MKVLVWHIHGPWTNAFVGGRHDYLLPVTAERDADGRGRGAHREWPHNIREVPAEELREAEIDVVVLQRPHEVGLVRQWTGRRTGVDLPAVFVEHRVPSRPFEPHPLAEQEAIPLVHVTHFNRQVWDSGSAPSEVIEYGAPDPGYLYLGDIARAAVVINDPAQRGLSVGADLVPSLGAPVDLFGHGAASLAGESVRVFDDMAHGRLHQELARRAVYVHPYRWTSLGYGLIEAMMLGMPVVGLDCTDISRAVPEGAGFLTNDLDELRRYVAALVADRSQARAIGNAARDAAMSRYGLSRFLRDWDEVLARAVREQPLTRPRVGRTTYAPGTDVTDGFDPSGQFAS